MAAAASWRMCDFQVHSPRDPNWEGERPLGSETGQSQTEVNAARARWAADLVTSCTAKGLGAVAITDHNEFVMFGYVRQELARLSSAGDMPDVWVFPGMELTASLGKQCIVLFDANIESSLLDAASGALTLNVADGSSSNAGRAKQLKITYPEIQERLEEVEELRGRFIVLPNVSQGGQHTVLVDKGHQDFAAMPYVGAYLDKNQSIDSLSNRQKFRLSGEDPTWGDRPIYPLPTTDSREAGYPRLGSNETWIKLANPTAEAIRQAFLAPDSRICIGRPGLPSVRITALEVAGTDPLGDTKLEMSPELNCIIGGRGCGKSTILEYIAFALGRSAQDLPEREYSGGNRLKALIDDTLIDRNATIRITIRQDEADFIITRGPDAHYRPEVRYPDGSIENVSPKELRSLFPAFCYSQGELAEIGRKYGSGSSLSDLLHFVQAPFKDEADKLDRARAGAVELVRTELGRLTHRWQLMHDRRRARSQLSSTRSRIKALRATLPELKPNEKAALDEHEGLVKSDKTVDAVNEGIQSIETSFGEAAQIAAKLEALGATISRPGPVDIQATLDSYLEQTRTSLTAFAATTKTSRESLEKQVSDWKNHLSGQNDARKTILAKISENRSVATQIADLQEEVAEQETRVAEIEKQLEANESSVTTFQETRKAPAAATSDKASRLSEWAREIEALAGGSVRISTDPHGDLGSIVDGLDVLARATGSQNDGRRSRFEEAVKERGADTVLQRIVNETLELLHWKIDGAQPDETPKFSELSGVIGSTKSVRSKLSELIDQQRIEALATAAPEPEVKFVYSDGTREIAFEKASEGQRSAVLVNMLLSQKGGPLIVDQPEGDLDNVIISDIADRLHSVKPNRQMIFSTHNANLLVNGSAEFVAFVVNADGRRKVDSCGAIDHLIVRDAITSTIEGGEKAFRDRQIKYGF